MPTTTRSAKDVPGCCIAFQPLAGYVRLHGLWRSESHGWVCPVAWLAEIRVAWLAEVRVAWLGMSGCMACGDQGCMACGGQRSGLHGWVCPVARLAEIRVDIEVVSCSWDIGCSTSN
eukprot:814307-Pelagomonas_calceolata.AAC.2